MHGTFPAPPAPQPRPGRAFGLAFRLAARELRAGLRGFAVFIGCIALGVASIAGVGSVARSLIAGVGTQGQLILGGDIALSLVQRGATPDELAIFGRFGRVSAIVNLRAMAIAEGGDATLVELKAVGPSYPEVGAVETEPARPLGELLAVRDGVPGAVADEALFARLNLRPGAEVTIGTARVQLRGVLMSEPDKIGAGIGFGPRLLLSAEGLAATGLVQPGSLMRSTYRLQLPPDARPPAEVAGEIKAALPDGGAGWEIRTRDNADPRFSRNIERFTQFLTLVGLTALTVGGVGVANAVSAFVDRKRASVATLKSLGATGGLVVAIYLLQVMAVALLGVLIGLAVGAAIPFGLAWTLRAALPIPIDPVLAPGDLGLAALYGLLTALAFSLVPLGRARDITVAGLFRDRVAPSGERGGRLYPALAAGAGFLLVALAVATAQDSRVALIFVSAAAAAFVLLRLIGAGIAAGARRLPRPRGPALRLALGNLHRPGALTPALVLSLGLGVTLLVTLAIIDANLRREIGRTLPERAPNFFFVDVPSSDADAFRAFLGTEAPGATVEATPMMRGRITALGDTDAGDVKAAQDAAWVLEGDRGITYAATVPEGSTVVAGRWWGPDETEHLVSMDAEIAHGLGVAVGDTITVNVLGRSLTARIANLRRIDWRRIGIGFVLVFSPSTFAGAPHTVLMTLTEPPGTDAAAAEPKLIRAVASRYPAITSLRVKDALDAVNAIVAQLVLAIRSASLVALLASLLVLAGALAAGQRARLYDAVVLKTLGATRGRLLAAYLMEYGALGVATAVFGLLAGTLAAWGVVTRVMHLGFTLELGGALVSAALAVLAAIVLGLLGTARILGQKPARHLRSL